MSFQEKEPAFKLTTRLRHNDEMQVKDTAHFGQQSLQCTWEYMQYLAYPNAKY